MVKVQHDQVVIDGHPLQLTNLDKVLYPETGTTKGEVLLYYSEIADRILPLLAHRPATRKRWPNGVGTGQRSEMVFFTKSLDSGTPNWVTRQSIEHSDGEKFYPIIDSLASLALMGQLAALELHVPQWKFDPQGKPAPPDRLVLDLDPGPGAGLAECVEVARQAHDVLTEIGLPTLPVTSGSKGLHLYAALPGDLTSAQVSNLAHELARGLETNNPDLVTSKMNKSLRPGKVFVDWSQNNAAKTHHLPLLPPRQPQTYRRGTSDLGRTQHRRPRPTRLPPSTSPTRPTRPPHSTRPLNTWPCVAWPPRTDRQLLLTRSMADAGHIEKNLCYKEPRSG